MNVLAQTTDPLGFMTEMRNSLADQGIAYVQVSQANMFKNYEFDTLYHEHYSFFSPSSLTTLARLAGFDKCCYLQTDIHGGSTLAIFGLSTSPVEQAMQSLNKGRFALGPQLSDDRPTIMQAADFSSRASATCTSLRTVCQLSRDAGKAVVMVGVAAKAVTVLQASGIELDFAVDEAKLKIGKFIPGTSVHIQPFEAISDIQEPCLFIIGAWNFKAEIEGKIKKLRKMRDVTVSVFPFFTLSVL